LLIILLSAAAVTRAQGDSCPANPNGKVWLGLSGGICSFGNYQIYFNGTLVASGPGNCTPDHYHQIGEIILEPTIEYGNTLEVTGACSTHLNFFHVPEGYALEINGKEIATIDKGGNNLGDGDGTWSITLRKGWGSDNSGESAGPKQGSVSWDVGLGNLGDGRWAGSIGLRSDSLNALIYTPSELLYSPPGYTSEVDVVRNQDSSLRQVKAPQALADIIVVNANQYELRFYRNADVGPKDQNGLYIVSNQPFVTWTISNPHVGYTDQLQISKTQNGVTSSGLYSWNSVNDSWTLTTGTGATARTETKTRVVDPITGDRTDTVTVTDSLAQVVSKIARTYHQFSWHEELIREVVDPDSASLTTTFTYYESSSEVGRFRRLKSVANPDGSWEQYDYDSIGNRVLVLRPWKDQTLASASEATSYAVRTTYSNYDGIIVSLHPRLTSSVIDKIAGVTARKTTYSRVGTTVNGEPAVIETQSSYASASVSQSTITTRYHSSASDFLVNRVSSVQYPDGRKDTYSYEKGDYTTNVDPSLNQFTPNPGGLTQRETLIHGTTSLPDGVAFKSTKETTVRDQFGHVVLQEIYVYTGTGYSRIGWSVMDYDDRGHLTQTRRINGTVVTATWNGDQKTADVDETGIETDYTYDSLNRVETQTKKGIAAGGGFPAQVDIVTTYNHDVEGRTKSETVSAGGLSLTNSITYDVVGRVKTDTNPAGLVTTHTYTNGGRTETIILPGGSSRVIDKYLDGQTKNILGTAEVNQFFDYGVNADSTPYMQGFIGSAGIGSPRWTKTTSDWLGRTIKVEKPSFITGTNLIQLSSYNPAGQLQTESTLAGSSKILADRLYEYDVLGNQFRVGSDLDGSGTLSTASADRIAESDFVYQQSGTDWFKMTSNKTYLINGNATLTTLRTETERLSNFSVNGNDKTISDLMVTDVAGNQTRTTISVDRAVKKETIRIDRPDSDTDAVEISVNGLPQSSAAAMPMLAITFSYDSLARLTGVINPATGTSSKAYSMTTGQVISESEGLQTTTYEYYPISDVRAGKLKTQTNPAGKKVYFNYNSRGEMVQTWGDTTYPVEYVFDAYGQRTEMHTFRGGSGWQGSSWPTSTKGTMDATRWIYQPSTGLLTDKEETSGKAVSYTYDALGRVLTRSWARLDAGNNRIATTYSYDPNTGELLGMTYSDVTPAVTFTYDRGGRQDTISDSAGSHTLTHNADGQLLSDQITGGLLDGVNLTIGYDGFLRRNSLQSSQNATTLSNQTYGYDTASRLQSVTSGSQSATYAYYPTSGFLNTTTFTIGTQISRGYDSLGRLQSIATTTPVSGTVASYSYIYNSLDQRTRVTREDNSYWTYGYNDRGELTSGKKYWSDDTPVRGQQTEYAFDNIGNRSSAKAGGDEQGLNLRLSTYTANSLNEYEQRTVPGAIDVIGSANSAATTTVNNLATYRRGEYFYKELAVDNSLTPVYQQVNAVGVRNGIGEGGEDAVVEIFGHVYLPKNSEVYSYDSDGNLLSDGRWNYSWDAENRLSSMEAISIVPNAAKQKLEFAYDWMNRRIQKKVYSWNSGTGTYQLQSTTKFVHDNWDLMAELTGSNALIRNYVWGSGELLFVIDPVNLYIAGFDGNDNITSLVGVSNGMVAAIYDYDSFGQNLQATGNYAATNQFKFSSKYQDSESGLSYYGRRYYNPQIGRWINRDPSEEYGGVNLYDFVNNDGINQTDLLGLCAAKPGKNIEFSVDDAPGVSNQEMRTFLSQNNIKITFFVEGSFAEGRQADVRAIVADGHSLGNHTWDHPLLTTLKNEQIKSQLTRTDAVIRQITGKSMAPNWRPPYGGINQRVRAVATSVGYTRAWLWDVDSLDWKYRGATQKIVDQVKSDLAKCNKQTCHILFHDYSTTVKALKVIIPMLKAEGHTIVNFTP
jgi:RHS repeat-associated protein